MTLELWDIDRFPLKTATPTPGQRAAEKWLAEHPDQEMRPVEPGMLDRITQQHEDDPRDRFFGVPTGGGGLGYGEGMEYPSRGYNRPERSYPNPGEEHEDNSDWSSGWNNRYHHEDPDLSDDDEEDDDLAHDYHIVTRPRDSIPGMNAFDEHQYHAFGPAYTGTADSAVEMFVEDHPECDTERYPDSATHEVIHAHSPEDHDRWHGELAAEDRIFNDRIAPHGLERESPEVPGHKAYRYEEPNGVIHRLWHSQYSSGGPSWNTSRYDPTLERDQQIPWTQHQNYESQDPLGDALHQFEWNKTVPVGLP